MQTEIEKHSSSKDGTGDNAANVDGETIEYHGFFEGHCQHPSGCFVTTVYNIYFTHPHLVTLFLCEKHRTKIEKGQITMWDQKWG